MLNVNPANRPTASDVWEHLKDMLKSLKANPHCEFVSPVSSTYNAEETDDAEITARKNIASMFAE
jgi:hypothetical protein